MTHSHLHNKAHDPPAKHMTPFMHSSPQYNKDTNMDIPFTAVVLILQQHTPQYAESASVTHLKLQRHWKNLANTERKLKQVQVRILHALIAQDDEVEILRGLPKAAKLALLFSKFV